MKVACKVTIAVACKVTFEGMALIVSCRPCPLKLTLSWHVLCVPWCCTCYLQSAGQDRENALLAARDEAAQQLDAARQAATAAAAQLAEVQAAAKAEAERLTGERQELDKQLKVAQVSISQHCGKAAGYTVGLVACMAGASLFL
jgi:hypothetical protein